MFYRVFVPHQRDGVMVASGRVQRTLPEAIAKCQQFNATRRTADAEVRPYGGNVTLWRAGMFFTGVKRPRPAVEPTPAPSVMGAVLDAMRSLS